MNNLNLDLANKQAFELMQAFVCKLQFLRAIHSQQLSLEHYELEVREVYNMRKEKPLLKVAYRHISHYRAPLNHKLFQIESSGLPIETTMNICISTLLDELKEYSQGKMPNEEALTQSEILIGRYDASIHLLSKICFNKVAIEDYWPIVRIRPIGKYQKTHYFISYQHKYFLSGVNNDQVYTCESLPNNPDYTLDDCIHTLIAQLKYLKR